MVCDLTGHDGTYYDDPEPPTDQKVGGSNPSERAGQPGTKLRGPCAGYVESPFVVVPGLKYDDVVAVDEVDQSVFVVDAPRPAPGEDVSEWLGFADPGERVS